MELLQEVTFMCIFLTLPEVPLEVTWDSGCEEPRMHINQLVPHVHNLHSMALSIYAYKYCKGKKKNFFSRIVHRAAHFEDVLVTAQ